MDHREGGGRGIIDHVQRWRGLDAIPTNWGRCVATIGVFDGVHRGHQVIISRAVEKAHAAQLPAVLVTFDPHPAEVVRPGSHPPVLTPQPYKAELVAELGIDVFCVLPFTVEFRRMPPKEFVHYVLIERLHAAGVVVGENFKFGHRATGNVQTLAELGQIFGFTTEGVPLFEDDGIAVSATWIRACIDAGDIADANHALGREFRLLGVVIRGVGRGREIGFPTANIETGPFAAIPADGVYAGRLVIGDDRFPAAVSIGTNPTFQGRERRVEAYVLDRDIDLYGRHVGIDFVARLRDMRRFETSDALVAEIAKDVERTRELTN